MSDPGAPGPAAAALIARFRMERIPHEGAWFAVTYRSARTLPAADGPGRPVASAILLLLTPRDFSALHRLGTDEIWHFHSGAPVDLLLLYPDGGHACIRIGPDPLRGETPQQVVPAGVWMGARPVTGDPAAYSLLGCTLAPAFDASEYEPGRRDELQAAHPACRDAIARLTRPEAETRGG